MLAEHDGLALLVRSQPVHEMVNEHAVGELARGRHEILVLAISAVGRLSRNRGVIGAGNPSRQIDVVRSKILDDADVGNTRRERRLAAGRDLVNLAELALGDAATHLQQRRIAPLDVADSANQALRLERLNELLALLDRGGQRLFHHRVNAGVGQLERNFCVLAGRHGDHRGVDAGVDQRVNIRKHLEVSRNVELIAIRIGDGDELGTLQRANVARVVAAHRAQPDQSITNRHYAPAFATALTASTMRSRSSCVSDG